MRIKHVNKLIIAHLNINSSRNIFEFLVEFIGSKVDILMISETKIDESFPLGQFKVNGFNAPFRLDRNINGGGIMLFVREDIPAKLIASETPPVEGLYVEVKLRKQKWLISCSYNPNKSMICQHMEALAKNMDLYSSTYENFIFLGDFNAGMEHSALKDFCNLYSLTSLINRPTCWKNPSKPTCIDLILTNRPTFFQNTNVIETGLSDFHKMVVSIIKTSFRKLKPKIINYRKYKNFSNDISRDTHLEELSQVRINNLDEGFSNFLRICQNTLNRFAHRGKKHIRGNNAPFMNKILSKEIMKRSNLRNKCLKNRSEEDR